MSLSDAPLTRRTLRDEIIAKLPARYHHLLVDACHAEAVVGARGLFDKERAGQTLPVDARDQTRLAADDADPTPLSVGTLFAQTRDQEAHEWSRFESGVFTHELISALSGGADVNHDGVIEYSEVHAFIAAANREVDDPRAAPIVAAQPPALNLHAPLARRDDFKRAAYLTGALGAWGHFYIEREGGERRLDANFSVGEEATLALPAESRLFVRRDNGEEAELVTRAGGDVMGPEQLAFSRRQIASRGSIDAAYRAALFAAPYGVHYYRGFVDSVGGVSVSFTKGPRVSQPAGVSQAPFGWKKPVSIAAWTLGGASLVMSAVSIGLMEKAKSDFDKASFQRPATQAADRYLQWQIVAIATGALGVGAIIAGALLWPKQPVTMTLAPRAGGGEISLFTRF